MSTGKFELSVSLPTDARFAVTARELAVYAAKQAGCSEARALAFGDEVEGAVRTCLQGDGCEARVPLIVRRTPGSIEVLVNGRALTVEP